MLGDILKLCKADELACEDLKDEGNEDLKVFITEGENDKLPIKYDGSPNDDLNNGDVTVSGFKNSIFVGVPMLLVMLVIVSSGTLYFQ